MRRFSTLFVLCAWLLASGSHWDWVQGFAWARMTVSYSRTMPVGEALRLTFTAENLCDVCEFVADVRTRATTGNDTTFPAPTAPGDSAAKGKLVLAAAPAHLFAHDLAPAPAWPRERFQPLACARPAPPTEPPRAV